jgi:hypothetical protein
MSGAPPAAASATAMRKIPSQWLENSRLYLFGKVVTIEAEGLLRNLHNTRKFHSKMG